MHTATVACPGCTGTMPLTAWTPGRQLRCPRCKVTFQLGLKPGVAECVGDTSTLVPAPVRTPTPTPVPVPTPAQTAAPVPVARLLPTPTASPAAPTPSPARPQDGNRRLGLIVAALGGLFLFVGGTVGLAVLVARMESKSPQGNNGPAIAQDSGGPTTPTNSTPGNPVPNSQPVQPPVVAVANPPMPPQRRLPPELQARVDAAIDKGVAFLQKTIRPNGALTVRVGGHPEGLLFLVGLTLLECGVPADDERMVKVTERVRAYAKSPQAVQTYDIALALLYLDKLADPQDRPLLQSLGLRLLAGQLRGGGWTYTCHRLSSEAEKQLLILLERTRPEKAGELMIRDSGGGLLELGGKLVREEDLVAGSIKDMDTAYQKLQGIQDDLKRFPELGRVASLQGPQGQGGDPRRGRRGLPWAIDHQGDNSNTQFASLGMWVASRHGIPCERALALLSARFRTSQAATGGWGYQVGSAPTPAMTSAGLLALAIGHGVRLEDANERREDPQIQRGLKALAEYLGSTQNGTEGLYFMWSLERVGVLFNLEKVEDVDWYLWGAEKLVPAQGGDGSWMLNHYPGSNPLADTSFALLFLRKSNFVRDLSNKLEQVLDIKGSRR